MVNIGGQFGVARGVGRRGELSSRSPARGKAAEWPWAWRGRAILLWMVAGFSLALAGILGRPEIAAAHSMPNSVLVLAFGERSVEVQATLPWAELKYDLPPHLQAPPDVLSAQDHAWLTAYMHDHVGAATPNGRQWLVDVRTIEVARDADHADLKADLVLTPPAGASDSRLLLTDRAVMDRVMSHATLVFAGGPPGSDEPPRLTGVLQNPTLTIAVSRPGSVRGFASAFLLGMRHIAGGADHMLFLLTLLLPAPLAAERGRWRKLRSPRKALQALAATATAFTIGHSITLVLGAAFDLHVPQQPVEVAIALSILVAASAAWRPLPGDERAGLLIAAGFGLVHGLSFAAVLGEFRLAPLAKAEAIAGFNLGIEAVQLAIVAVVAPALIALARTPAYGWIRALGAAGAGGAALVWIVVRISS